MKQFNTRGGLLRSTIIAGLAGGLFAVAPAFAQEEEAAPEAADGTEKIVITGSRIARSNLTAPTSVTTVDAATIELTGNLNTAEILRDTPAFGVSGITATNSNFSTASGGLNTLQLRSLGEDRTLVLVNGRRWVSGLPGSAAVDFNTIPTEMVERVEVITGGASAVYGSDALAGAINIILKDDFEGVTGGYQFGQNEEGDDITHRGAAYMGGNFADGKGNAVVGLTYSQEQGVKSRDRAETATDDIALCLFTGDVNDCATPFEPFFSSFGEGGRFFLPSVPGNFAVRNGTGPDGDVVPFETAVEGFNRQERRTILVPVERLLFTGLANYEVTPGVELFVETTFSNTEVSTDLEPFPHSYGDAFPVSGGISIDNPFVPQALRDAAIAAGDDTIGYVRRMSEVGNRGYEAKRDTFRYVTGLRGELMGKYDWELFYSNGRTLDNQVGGGQVNVGNIRNALDVVDLDGNAATTDDIVCADLNARAEGCVPLNLFGRGSITPEAAAYISAPTQRQASIRQETFGSQLSGPLFSVPAGEVGFAAGAEWRRESSKDIPDALTQTGQNAGNKEEPTIGSYSVAELFAEVDAPIIANKPFFHELSVGGAYRYSDYNTIGETNAYAARATWAPIEQVRFRSQYARAVRAPNIGELFSPGGENFAPVADPCNNVTATTPGDTAANCRADPFIAARIAATGAFILTQPEIQGTGGFTSAGNQNLTPETSDSLNFGVVYNESFDKFGDILVSLDWFQIEIEDTIGTVGRQSAVNFCYTVSPAEFPNAFCDLIVRDGRGAVFQQGEITEVNSGFINDGTIDTEGLDFAFVWDRDVKLGRLDGSLQLRGNYSYLIKFDSEQLGATSDSVGSLGAPEHEAQGAIVWRQGPFTFQWDTTYTGESAISVFADNDFKIDSYINHDIQGGWDVTDRLNLYAGVDNLLKEDAPIILSGIPGNVTGTDTAADVFNPLGRSYYAGFRVKY